MKTLLAQQSDIAQNQKTTKGATEEDLIKALNLHARAIVPITVLSPIDNPKRKLEKCHCIEVMFETIDGCFCKKCGEVLPF
jgi:hypothetical protein